MKLGTRQTVRRLCFFLGARVVFALGVMEVTPCLLTSIDVFMLLIERLKFTWREEEEEDGWVVVLGREEGLLGGVELAC